MMQLNTILVAFDFSESSEKALVYGRNLRQAFGGQLHVLHVADVIATTAAQFYPDEDADAERRAETLALTHLRAVVPDETTRLAARVDRSPASAIVSFANDIHADVIVVGTHGRGGVSRLLMGSVAEHVVRHASCPVLVVRRDEREFVQPDPAAPVSESRLV